MCRDDYFENEELDEEYDEDCDYDDEDDCENEDYIDPDENCGLGYDCDCCDCNICVPYGGPSYCPHRLV